MRDVDGLPHTHLDPHRGEVRQRHLERGLPVAVVAARGKAVVEAQADHPELPPRAARRARADRNVGGVVEALPHTQLDRRGVRLAAAVRLRRGERAEADRGGDERDEQPACGDGGHRG
ncbi:MAG: hypothetical protein F4Z08_06180 [Chloroflexi bacterium]|nr:hypothetical protein [Chloroflexota bacterium]